MNQALDERRCNPIWASRYLVDRDDPRWWEGDGPSVVRQREDRVERENDAVLVLERQPVMIGIRGVQMMGFIVAVDHPLVMAVFLDFMDMLGRRQWEGGDPERKHGSYDSGRKHASSSHYVLVQSN